MGNIVYHTEHFEKNGEDFVILPADEFKQMQELIEDAEDVLDLELAVKEEQHIPGFTLEEVRQQLKL